MFIFTSGINRFTYVRIHEGVDRKYIGRLTDSVDVHYNSV